jgi:tetratricopeptide (TPR) repeat protein
MRMNRLILFIGVWFAVLKPLDVGAEQDWRQEKNRMDALSAADPDAAITMGLQLSAQASDGNAWAWAAEFAASAGDILLQANQLDSAAAVYGSALGFFQMLEDEASDSLLRSELNIAMVRANILLAQDRYIEAKEAYDAILVRADENFELISAHATNNLGVLFLRLDDWEKASEFFTDAQERFDALGELYNSTICEFNLGVIEQRQDRLDEALVRLRHVSETMAAQEAWGDFANTNNEISRVYRRMGALEQAEIYLKLALETLDSELINPTVPVALYRTEIYLNAAYLYQRTERYDSALDFAKQCMEVATSSGLQDQIAQSALIISEIYAQSDEVGLAYAFLSKHLEYLNQIRRESSFKEIVQLEMRHELDQALKEAKLDRLEEQAKEANQRFWLTAVLSLSLLVSIILLWLFMAQRSRSAQRELERRNLELEKSQLNQDLVYKKKELTTTMMYLLEKNQFLVTIAEELSEAKEEFSKKNQTTIQRVINELLKNSSRAVWEEFEAHFIEVHFSFYEGLTRSYPDLTLNERRLCAFLRLNLTTKEISAITHQSIQSINMARFRLRKKLRMEAEEDLIRFLSEL